MSALGGEMCGIAAGKPATKRICFRDADMPAG